jgi:hypothetical protein
VNTDSDMNRTHFTATSRPITSRCGSGRWG